MKTVGHHDLKVGDFVVLADGPAPKSKGIFGTFDYLQPSQVGEVTYHGGYAQFRCYVDGRRTSRYIDDLSAKYRVLTAGKLKEFQAAARAWKKANGHADISKGQGKYMGSDPEVFAVDAAGVVLPAWRFLPDKHNGNPFWDGFQAEFTVEPDTCHAFVVDHIQYQLRALFQKLKEHDPGATLTAKTVLDVPPAMMAAIADEHAALGCAPSTNIYPDSAPLTVADPRVIPYRFAGCHIHLGYGKVEPKKLASIVKTMDAFYGVISVSLFAGLEDERRRRFYGMAGEYRTPPHGIEYRVPSSMVLCHPAATHLSFDLTRFAAYMAEIGYSDLWETPSEKKVRAIINEYDVKGARKVLTKNKDFLKMILKKIYPMEENNKYPANPVLGSVGAQKAEAMILGGVKEHLNPDEMEKSWCLNGDAKEWLYHSETSGRSVYRL